MEKAGLTVTTITEDLKEDFQNVLSLSIRNNGASNFTIHDETYAPGETYYLPTPGGYPFDYTLMIHFDAPTGNSASLKYFALMPTNNCNS
ncbi:MAG: hypothetical protein HRT68_15790 [Flavobacteriaceae bacterium]|nr:hypothetical protein [Flavobacteriaceae bacterium]